MYVYCFISASRYYLMYFKEVHTYIYIYTHKQEVFFIPTSKNLTSFLLQLHFLARWLLKYFLFILLITYTIKCSF